MMIFTLFASIAIALVAVLLSHLGRVAVFTRASNLPRARSREYPWLPFGIGASLEFNNNPLRFLQNQRNQLGDLFRVNFGVFEWIFVLGIKAQTMFFRAHNDVLNFAEGSDALIGNAGAGARDKEWDKLNPLITKGFMKQERQPIFIKIASEVADSIIERWPKAGSVDLFKEMSNAVLRIGIRSILGDRVHDAHSDKLIPLYQRFEADLVDRLAILSPRWLPLPSRIRNKRLKKYLDSIVSEEVRCRFEEMKQGKDMPNDYLQLLIQTGERFLHMFGAHLLLIIMAAHTNTAGTAAWTLGQIYADHDLLERVRKEIAVAVGESQGFDARRAAVEARLPLLTACLRETGRLYSAHVLLRKCKSSFEVGGQAVPSGCMVATFPRATSDDVHVEQDRYIPDRWLLGTAAHAGEVQIQAPSNQVVDAQFGAGRHPCLGERFAITVMTTIWVSLIRELDFEFVDPESGRVSVSQTEFMKVYPQAIFAMLGTPWSRKPLFLRATRRHKITKTE